MKVSKKRIWLVVVIIATITFGIFGYQEVTKDQSSHTQISQQELTNRVYFASKLLARNEQALALAKVATQSSNTQLASAGDQMVKVLARTDLELNDWLTNTRQLGINYKTLTTEFGIPASEVREALTTRNDKAVAKALSGISAKNRLIEQQGFSGEPKLQEIAQAILDLDKATSELLASVTNSN